MSESDLFSAHLHVPRVFFFGSTFSDVVFGCSGYLDIFNLERRNKSQAGTITLLILVFTIRIIGTEVRRVTLTYAYS